MKIEAPKEDQLETRIRIRLEVYKRLYNTEKRINEAVAEYYLREAHGYRGGLEETLSKEYMDPILRDYSILWEDYEN